jgi:membrane fusion protein, multidrug efflux system
LDALSAVRGLAAALPVAAAAVLAGCGNEASSAKRPVGPPAVLITVTTVQPSTLEVYEEVVGSMENVVDPKIGAEVAGRVTRVTGYTGKKVRQGELLAEIDAQDFEIQQKADHAEIARLQSLLAQQDRVVERQRKLVGQGFISQNAVDDALAQRNALREQLAGAGARSEGSKRSLGKTRVVAPTDGEIETQIVAAGDYVKVGDPLFRLVGVQKLRAHLPLPESAAVRIRPGLKVVLSVPAAPERRILARIDEIKPTVGTANRALDAIVKFESEGTLFRGGGSVDARIVIETRENALMVPEQSTVLRPAGKVVYLVRDGKAEQRVVETGIRLDGRYEVVKGLVGGETVAVDGAGFLTHGAAVTLPKPKPPAGESGKGKPASKSP